MALSVTLIRDGPGTPWGFRLYGGRDLNLPLSIQKVNIGSPSEGELHVGDIILAISGKDAAKMSHQSAIDLIKKAGSQLALHVHRSGGTYRALNPLSPVATLPRSHPLTSPFPKGAPYTPDAYLTQEQYEYLVEKEREKQAITNQPFRSTPLILPRGRPRHDVPLGSYLRHEQQAGGVKNRPGLGDRINDAAVMAKLQEAVSNCSLSSRTSTPDSGGPMLVHRQYNSPLALYSPAAVAQALVDQTGAQLQHPLPLRETVKEMILSAASSISSGHSSNPGSPLPRSQPTSPLRMYSITDISKSPTYQVVHNEEWAQLNRGELKEYQPVESLVHDIKSQVARPRDDLTQSLSFKNLMQNLYCTRPIGGDL